jgi:ATP-grasp domain-containing protein/L-aminoacid ligase-like protein
MPRVLLLATTTGYQTRAFGEAAERLGVDLVFATDRCDVLEDPWQDSALPIRFHDEPASVMTILESARRARIDGILAVGDRPTPIAARVAEALGLPGHRADAVQIARTKHLTRARLRDAGLPVPSFRTVSVDVDPRTLRVSFPCVVKPAALSGSRGVMRADNESELAAAFNRLRRLLQAPDIRSERSDLDDTVVIEDFIHGAEFAVEGLLTNGTLQVLAIFDKPDPLDGPFFEETIYVTPSLQSDAVQERIVEAVGAAASAIGLHHGPIHAECRVNPGGAFVLEAAARPIGGLCARALRFTRGVGPSFSSGVAPDLKVGPTDLISLEELLMRHALGESTTEWRREDAASGVMMIPIPRRGVYRGVAGIDEAAAVPGIVDVRITAKNEQVLVPLPEGASYLGFIFARTGRPRDTDAALRAAHGHLVFVIDPELRVVQSAHG